jgi:APA family basic amino acid/polyamine antiporter
MSRRRCARQPRLLLDTAFGIAICIGSTIGVGILRVPGEVASLLGSPWWIAAAWLFGAAYALLCANYVAELATMLPGAGGPYVYAKRAFGELTGFVVGFSDWSLITASLAFLAVACGEYLAILIPSLAHYTAATALVVLLLFALVNAYGLRAGSGTQKLTSAAKAISLLLFVLACFLLVPRHAHSHSAPASLSFASAGLAMQLVLGTYGGWNAPVYFASEDRDPTKTLPRSLFAGVLLVTSLYLLVNAALLYALPAAELRTSILPVASALQLLFGGFSSTIATVLALVLLLSIINAGILTTPRVLVGLSRDRLIGAMLSHVSTRGVPSSALWLTVGVAMALSATGTFESLLAHYAVVTVALNLCVATSYFRLRRAEPATARPFRAWGYPIAPLLAMMVDAALLAVFLVSQTSKTLYSLSLLAMAVPLYFIAKRLLARRVSQTTLPR